jgi:hypothetical protein
MVTDEMSACRTVTAVKPRSSSGRMSPFAVSSAPAVKVASGRKSLERAVVFDWERPVAGMVALVVLIG